MLGDIIAALEALALTPTGDSAVPLEAAPRFRPTTGPPPLVWWQLAETL